MKKVVSIIVLVVILGLWAMIATVGFLAAQDANDEELQRLEAENAALKDAQGDTDITVIRGLAYELLFELVYYGEEYDLDAEIDKVVEQYELDEMEETELLLMVDTLIRRYEVGE